MADLLNRPANNMSKLCQKIERRLGVKALNLPDDVGMPYWPTIIKEDTIPTFSRYFPYGITVVIDNTCEKDGYYFIDSNVPSGAKIIGVSDVDWQSYRCDPRFDRYGINFSTYDFISRDYGIDDVAFSQVSADFLSLFNLGIYIEFLPPNKIRLVSVNGSPVSRYRPFPLKIFIEHPDNLMTISPTMMETFERLAQADVATFLYHTLKFYDGFDTIFATIDLKAEALQEWMNKRDDIVRELDEAHTTTANEHQILMMTV